MEGEPHSIVKSIVAGYVGRARNIPNAIETVYLSLISFGNERTQVVSPLISICEFDLACLNTLAALGERLAGSGLKLLESRAKYEIQRTTPDLKGDLEATLFVFVGANQVIPLMT